MSELASIALAVSMALSGSVSGVASGAIHAPGGSTTRWDARADQTALEFGQCTDYVTNENDLRVLKRSQISSPLPPPPFRMIFS